LHRRRDPAVGGAGGAARAALRRAEEEIVADHAAHCVEHAIASGNKAEQRRKVGELIDVLSRSDR
jgi:CsoR family transcriptional regulator, copper-sensing transcriptional repressor